MSTDTTDLAEVSESIFRNFPVFRRRSQGQHKDGRVVLEGTTLVRNFDNPVNGALTVFADTSNNILAIIQGYTLFRSVIVAAFGTKNQEAVEMTPLIQNKGETSCVILRHICLAARNSLGLGSSLRIEFAIEDIRITSSCILSHVVFLLVKVRTD